jgi:hypothetical protein
MKIEARDIFEQIGNAFYAVAKDHHLKACQRDELKSLISGDWLPRNVSNDGVVSNEAHCILMTIDANEGQDLSARDAFKEFSRFYQLHQDAFSADLRQKILETAVEISDNFNEESANENILRRLNELFYR